MTDKERLEDIKKTVKKARNYLDESKNDGDFNYPKHDELALRLFDNNNLKSWAYKDERGRLSKCLFQTR